LSVFLAGVVPLLIRGCGDEHDGVSRFQLQFHRQGGQRLPAATTAAEQFAVAHRPRRSVMRQQLHHHGRTVFHRHDPTAQEKFEFAGRKRPNPAVHGNRATFAAQGTLV